MNASSAIKFVACYALAACAAPAFAHMSLETKSAPASSTYKAVFILGHGCAGSATNQIAIQLPEGFQGARPYPKAGWTVTAHKAKLAKPYDNHGKAVTEDVSVVTWKANSKDAAVPDAFADEFVLRGKTPANVGPAWFKVLQTCDKGSENWADVPASGKATTGLKSPAVLLDITPAAAADGHAGHAAMAAPTASGAGASARVTAKQGWVRATVAGQTSTGAFMDLTAPAGLSLVGVSSPVAGVAEVHEMKVENNVMKMRAIPNLALPAGKTVALKPGGYHVMLMDLKQPVAAGTTVPVTLLFKDRKGASSQLALDLPVALVAPGAKAGAAAPADAHQH